MCIAILNLKNTLKREYITNSYNNNYHGAGFAYSNGESMVVYKTDKGASAFYKAYKAARKKNPDIPFLLHFRISTHGTISHDNLHPFVINDKVAFIHNGMVDLTGHSSYDKRSDTRYLCEEILAKLPDGWQHSAGVHSLLSEIGGWSKFVTLDLEHKWSIINEDQGHWHEENWYSNNSYKSYSTKVNYGGKWVDRGSVGGSSYGGSNAGTGSSWGAYRGNVFVNYETLTKIEGFLSSMSLIKSNRFVFSAYVDQHIVDSYTAYADEVDFTAIEDEPLYAKDNVYYKLPEYEGTENEVKAVNVYLPSTGKRYTVLAHKGEEGTTSCKALPFVINDLTLMGEVLRVWIDDLNRDALASDNAKLEAAYDKFSKYTFSYDGAACKMG